ncbi:hypothetical protein SKAU_G00403220 [Synaphobranchus kaupii]|uniref:Uncharacterized protein n=1 Tax=Synaphobranchus kaupii TaxID=118154 RepID=A0A9Q1E9F8_SYNKA|nr:hypothetical protein SKAU_G00403220 [Synaphobranchus kaupii]
MRAKLGEGKGQGGCRGPTNEPLFSDGRSWGSRGVRPGGKGRGRSHKRGILTKSGTAEGSLCQPEALALSFETADVSFLPFYVPTAHPFVCQANAGTRGAASETVDER